MSTNGQAISADALATLASTTVIPVVTPAALVPNQKTTLGAMVTALSAGGATPLAHSALSGLATDDHMIYTKADGTRAFTGVVTGVDPSSAQHLVTKNYVDATRKICCRVKLSADQAIANTTVTALAFGAEDFDSGGLHDTAVNNSRITIPTGKAGIYLIIGHVIWDANATGARLCRFRLNGAGDLDRDDTPAAGGGLQTGQTITAILNLAAGDYLELMVYQSSGGSLNALAPGSVGGCRFEAVWLFP